MDTLDIVGTETETENGSNEDDVHATKDDIQAMDMLDIVGKSLAPNVFFSHNFFPRCTTSRVVNSSSVCIIQLDNTFSESLLTWFSNNHLIEKARYIKLLKLLCASFFYQNRDLEVITNTNDFIKAMD